MATASRNAPKLTEDDRAELAAQVREEYPDATEVNVTYYDNEMLAEVWRNWDDSVHSARVIPLGSLLDYV